MMNLVTKFVWFGFLFGSMWHCESENSLPKNISIDHYLQLQHDMISAVRNHLNHEHQRLDSLQKQLSEWKSWRKSYFGKENEYITVPQNIFHLFKNMTLELDNVEKIIRNNSHNDTIAQVHIEAPTKQHLERVIMSLIDLQYTYDIKPENIMKGEFITNIFVPVETCLSIGEACSKYNEHKCVVDWLNATIPYTTDQEHLKKIYRLMYNSYLFLNNTEETYTFADHYLGLEPLDIPANDVKISLGDQLGKSHYLDPTIVESHKVCRGLYKQMMDARNLKCRYNHVNSSFLKIAPLKEEELNDYPKIIRYYDAIYESEINTLKTIATDKLMTSTVYGNDGQKRVTGFIYRISQTAFIDNRLPELSLLFERIQDMSDLSLENSEWWQVVNYSPGGFYRVHSDYLPTHGDYVNTSGNRIATLLFYLNDVPLGGETVFPKLKLAISPVKGSVLTWHNVLPDGSENSLTYHSACPVIIGEKWIFTQWIRAKGQKSLRNVYGKYVSNRTKKKTT
ncbi:prolyl 4-hydroxylase subunit alpha-1-like [Planococcus citri]|uniref:prolyl 4-hydroxylase subunit alpha-1-like n=1 Tax=Planococcus citri TaxID=170843 RepID=UPI0031F944B3